MMMTGASAAPREKEIGVWFLPRGSAVCVICLSLRVCKFESIISKQQQAMSSTQQQQQAPTAAAAAAKDDATAAAAEPPPNAPSVWESAV
jgi:hypothetical protein